MAVTVGRGFLVQPCSSSSFIFPNKIYKFSLGAGSTFWSTPAPRRYGQIAIQAQQRSTCLPGLDPPPYLDGTLAGDYGLDPLGLGEDPESLKWYVQAELVHARFAMAGVAGILFTDLLRVTGISNLPVWYEAGAVKFEFASCPVAFDGVEYYGITFYFVSIETKPPNFFRYAELCIFVWVNSFSFSWLAVYVNRFAETKRYMNFISPGSQAKEGSFF